MSPFPAPRVHYRILLGFPTVQAPEHSLRSEGTATSCRAPPHWADLAPTRPLWSHSSCWQQAYNWHRKRPPCERCSAQDAASLTVAAPGAPAFDSDAPDPDVVTSGSAYYAFTTGTALGNHIQVLIDSSGSAGSGWHSTTGKDYGSSALPIVPSWEQANTQTSPGVFYWNGHWIMYYDAAQKGHGGDTGYDCLSIATATTLAPTNAVFTDTSSGPLVCDTSLGGAIDPSPFIDTKDGPRLSRVEVKRWRIFPGCHNLVAATKCGRDVPCRTPTDLLDQDSVRYPWEATVENPQLVEQGGRLRCFCSLQGCGILPPTPKRM